MSATLFRARLRKGAASIPGIVLLLVAAGMAVACAGHAPEDDAGIMEPWRFAVVGDTHVTVGAEIVREMIPCFLQDGIQLVLVCGDIVEGGKRTTRDEMRVELELWQEIFAPLYAAGIGVYPVRGNHENDIADGLAAWNQVFSGARALPQNGPAGESNLSYSFVHENALFIALDNYIAIHEVNLDWLERQLAAARPEHVFIFGHEPAFKAFHSDCLDDRPGERTAFWEMIAAAGARIYFCGHDHFFDAARIDDGDGDAGNDLHQIILGGGGGWLMAKYNYNGDNGPYAPTPVYHRNEHGYALVEVGGHSADRSDVAITWKERQAGGNEAPAQYSETDNVLRYSVPGR